VGSLLFYNVEGGIKGDGWVDSTLVTLTYLRRSQHFWKRAQRERQSFNQLSYQVQVTAEITYWMCWGAISVCLNTICTGTQTWIVYEARALSSLGITHRIHVLWLPTQFFAGALFSATFSEITHGECPTVVSDQFVFTNTGARPSSSM